MLEQQMELFEDGGLKDEGGEVDEVSGNEVPIGGTKKGVRDDVPAMVSEGEFVFPEDVTRYIGLDKLMQMRQEAKMGLKRMEAMGQMGNGDEATMPDDMPFTVADLIVVSGDTGEELEMQDGGFVVRPTTARRTEPQPTYTQPTDQDAQQPVFKTTRRLLPEREEPQPIDLDFSGVMGEGKISFKDYRNEKGENILIPFIGDSPVFPIPEGYTLYTGEDSSANTNEVASKVNEISQAQEKDKYEVPDFLKPQPPKPTDWAAMPTDELVDELGSVTGTARLITKGAMMLMGPVGLVGNLMMRDQDKNIVAAIDAALAKGGLSAEDKTTLTAAKEELTKSGMLSFLDPIIDGVASVLGVPEEQVNASVNANVQSGAVEVSPRSRARPVAEEPAVEEQNYTSTGAQMQASQRALQDIVPAPEPAETTDASNYLRQRLASGQGGDSFTGGDYDVASNDPNFVSDADEKYRKDLPEIRKAFYGDGSATPQVELTQQPAPVTDAYVGSLDAASQYRQQPTTTQPVESIVNAPPRKTNVVTTDMQLAPVPPSFSTVPKYMDTDTGTPSYTESFDPYVMAEGTAQLRTTPRVVPDTSEGVAAISAFDRYDAPQESGVFTKDGISMLPSADVDTRSTKEYIASQQPLSLQEQALNLLSPEAQNRVLNQDTDATIANAKKVVSDSSDVLELAPPVSQTVETSLRPKSRPSVTDQVKALGIDVDSPFATATPTKAPVAAPLRSFSDAKSMAKRKALAARPTPLVTTEEPVDTAPSYATMPVGEKGRGVVSTGKGRDIDKAFDPKEKGGTETFSEAFARNKREGKKTFTYKGKKYTTETKEEKAAKPKRDTGSKSNRLDKSNPNTEINFNEHLAEWEKNMARSDPALAQHFILTANRRQNDIEKTGKDPQDKISAKKTDESGGLGGWIKKQFGKKKGGLATRY